MNLVPAYWDLIWTHTLVIGMRDVPWFTLNTTEDRRLSLVGVALVSPCMTYTLAASLLCTPKHLGY